jgi:hypothetical protein
MITKEEIRHKANQLGLTAVGFTHPGPFERAKAVLEQRKKQGYLSGFEVGYCDRRCNPQLHMDDIKSIISVGLPYRIPVSTPKPGHLGLKGTISGSAVIDGKLVEPFNGYPGDLFFAGVNKDGQVIGTVPQSEKDITKLNPYQGVSFIPVLLKDGKKVDIPDDWAKTNQPRTIIGKYANDDLIMIVIDGRQGSWSIGVTLEHLQDKLLSLGVKEAYNLDGGGSSAMYFNGKVLNKPSDGKERPVANNIVVFP